MSSPSRLPRSQRLAALLIGALLSAGVCSREAAAQPGGAQERDLCVIDDNRCLRDCADLTICSRRCCERLHDCLAAKGCEIRAPACAR